MIFLGSRWIMLTHFSLNHSFLVMSLISRFVKTQGFDETLVQILDNGNQRTWIPVDDDRGF